MKKSVFIVITLVGVAALAAGLGVLIWWLVAGRDTSEFTTVVLQGSGFSNVQHTAALTRIRGAGDLFWLFHPTEASTPETRPLLLWLDGITGLPPSLLANFAMFGPLDFNLNRRNGSWVENFNLLFVDAPLGTGFSTATGDESLPTNEEENTAHLLFALESFFNTHQEYQNTPLYIFGQGDGAKLALSAAVSLTNEDLSVPFSHNLRGVVLGNGVIAPAQTLRQLDFYLSEMGYVDPLGRAVVEEFTSQLAALVDTQRLEEAFDQFLTVGDFINEEVGAAAVNLGYLIQKLTREQSRVPDYFGQRQYLRSALQVDVDFEDFMLRTVAPALGVTSAVYDQRRDAVIQAFRGSYMESAADMVGYILENTTLNVTMYNGNLDAVSTTPGQLDWLYALPAPEIQQTRSLPRQALVVNGLLHGYFKESDRFSFYWVNAAGVSAPLDSPDAMRSVLFRACG